MKTMRKPLATVIAALALTFPSWASAACDPPPVVRVVDAFPVPRYIEGARLPSGLMLTECLPVGVGSSAGLVSLAAAVDRLSGLGEVGAALAGTVEETGIRLCVHAHVDDARGWFEPHSGMLSLAAGLSTGDMTLVLAHELRHLDQWRRGWEHTLDVTMAEHVRRTYALEADATAFAVWVAWKLRETGDEEAWPAALGFEHYGDVAVAFGARMEESGDDAGALLAAFRLWYASPWRTTGYWRSACGNYLDRADDLHRPAGSDRLAADAFDGLCVVPGVGDYGCASTEEIARSPSVPAG